MTSVLVGVVLAAIVIVWWVAHDNEPTSDRAWRAEMGSGRDAEIAPGVTRCPTDPENDLSRAP